MKKHKNPFSNLGKDEGVKPSARRISKIKTQGKRVSGVTLLQKAMGRLANG